MTILLLLLALGLTGASPVIDDKVCQPHSRPWQVVLRNHGSTCSGALINEWWIVTSFSCAPTSSSAIVSLGEHDKTMEEGTEQHIEVAEVIRHSPYRSPLHSLTMVRLARPARFNQYVQPIPLSSRCPKPGETCYVSGWGSTMRYQYGSQQYLKCLSVPIVDDQTCMNSLPNDIYWGPFMLCGGQAHTDNCLTDESSVMVCDGKLQGLEWMGFGCNNPANPTVYTKLCKYNNWINNVMNNYQPTFTTAIASTT